MKKILETKDTYMCLHIVITDNIKYGQIYNIMILTEIKSQNILLKSKVGNNNDANVTCNK